MASIATRLSTKYMAVLLLAAVGCDGLGISDALSEPLACGAVAIERGFGEGIGNLISPSHALTDDAGEILPSVKARCATDACETRVAQAGTLIDLRVDLTALAASRKVSLDSMQPTLVSTDPEVIRVADGSAKHDPCINGWSVSTTVKFAEVGQAALLIQHGATELARFSFEVAQAANLEVTALPGRFPDSLEITGTEQRTHSVRAGLGTGVSLRVQAHAADGRVMLLDNHVRSTIDDPTVAQFALSDAPDNAHGVQVYVVLSKEGSTMLRVASGEITALVELQGDATLPSPQPLAAGTGGARPTL